MRKVDGLFLSPKSKKEVNHNDKTELTAEISVLEKAVKSYEKHEKDADRFIALIDKYENFDKLTIAMLNEFIEKILVHAHRFFIYIKWCKNVLLKGLTAVDGPSWHVVPAACDHVVIVHTFFRCIGDNDCFLSRFLEEDALSQEKGVHEIRNIYPGGHDWNVWRPCFTDFAQMIFR